MCQGNDEAEAMLRLSFCEGIGPVAVHRLLDVFGSAAEVLGASAGALRKIEGIGPETVSRIRKGPDPQKLERELDLAERSRTRFIPSTSPDYPHPLKQLGEDAPPLLRVRGDYRRPDMLAMALVGSRRCTHYGVSQARRFAMGLCGMEFTIVSGLARGIDAEAHRATIQARGRTLAVLGCGLSRLDALNDPELALEVADHGALISELPMRAPPLPRHFPPRNRLISGLSLGVLVLEAGKKSGSLITARWAGEQGKSVFALPGQVDSSASRGCHALIRDGATLVENPRELVEELGPLSDPLRLPEEESDDGEAGRDTSGRTVTDPREMTLNDREQTILETLGTSPLPVDSVIDSTGLPASIVSSTLLTLEIKGLIQQLPGGNYVRASGA